MACKIQLSKLFLTLLRMCHANLPESAFIYALRYQSMERFSEKSMTHHRISAPALQFL